MLAKLDRLPMQPEAVAIPDFSLLSPENQDRVHGLFSKIRDPHTGIEPTISTEELAELEGLIADLPALGPNDKFAGPKIEVPCSLARYWEYSQHAAGWQPYDFGNLGKVETLRFVELCGLYGWNDPHGAVQLKDRMVPFCEWQTGDQAEMTAMLEKAATPRPPY